MRMILIWCRWVWIRRPQGQWELLPGGLQDVHEGNVNMHRFSSLHSLSLGQEGLIILHFPAVPPVLALPCSLGTAWGGHRAPEEQRFSIWEEHSGWGFERSTKAQRNKQSLTMQEVEHKAEHIAVSQGTSQTLQNANQAREEHPVAVRTLPAACVTARGCHYLTIWFQLPQVVQPFLPKQLLQPHGSFTKQISAQQQLRSPRVVRNVFISLPGSAGTQEHQGGVCADS